MTQEFLQDAIVEDLKAIFQHSRLKNSLGVERAIQVFPQDVPVRESDDEGEDKDAPPEPYIVVRLMGGKAQDGYSPQFINVILVVCVYDQAPDRQGFRDTMHIINEVYSYYAENGVIGKRFVLQYPIEWTTQEEDTHPYYFAAMALNVEAPAVHKEVPYT